MTRQPPTPTTALDVPRDIAGHIEAWRKPYPWQTGGTWSREDGAARWQHADVVSAMCNRNGKTPAEIKTSHEMARRYILKHMDASACAHCGAPIVTDTGGRPRKYCSDAHRRAAHRARQGVKAAEHRAAEVHAAAVARAAARTDRIGYVPARRGRLPL